MSSPYSSFWSHLVLEGKIDHRVIPSNRFDLSYLQFYIFGIPFLHYEIIIKPVSFTIALYAEHELIHKIYLDYFKNFSKISKYKLKIGKRSIGIEFTTIIYDLIHSLNELIDATYETIVGLYKNAVTGSFDVFEDIYQLSKWTYGSGSGSDATYLQPYILWLSELIEKKNIKSIIDCGCGDWQYMKYVKLGEAQYRGFDVSPTIVALDSFNYSSPNVAFSHYFGDFNALPAGDLIICKEVLQHLSIATVNKFISILPKYKYALIANVANEDPKKNNSGTYDGGYNDLDITLPPFSVKGELVMELPKNKPQIMRFYLIDSEK